MRHLVKGQTEDTALNTLNLIFGALLFVSPWLFGFASNPTASWNAWLAGAAIAVIAVIALTALDDWEEWLNLLLGAWVVISPWVLGFAGLTYAMWSHVVLGIAVAVFAAVELWRLQGGGRHTAGRLEG